MELKVLAVPDCPNVVLLEQRLAQVTEGRRDVTVSRQVIADQGQADRWGMHGSPTILVDGTDPFAEEGEPASLSCRLYQDGNGQVDGAPSVSQLRRAIGEAGRPMDEEAIAILHVTEEPPYGCELELRDPDGNRLRISVIQHKEILGSLMSS
jgi:hypothetical protein